MKEIEVNGHKIEFYSSSELLPIKRYQRFNKYLMIDNDVGSTFEDYDKRSLRVIEFLKKSMHNEAVKELTNRRQMVFNAFEEYSPNHLSFAIMIKAIDGEDLVDYSEENLLEVIKKLDSWGLSQAKLDEVLTEVKKNSMKN